MSLSNGAHLWASSSPPTALLEHTLVVVQRHQVNTGQSVTVAVVMIVGLK